MPILGNDFLTDHRVTMHLGESTVMKIGDTEVSCAGDNRRCEATFKNGKQVRQLSDTCGDEVESISEEEGLVFVATVTNERLQPKELCPELPMNPKSSPSRELAALERNTLSHWDHLFDGLGKTDIVKHRIETGDALPVRNPSYRLPKHLLSQAKDQINKLKNQGVIQPSNSEWCSPIVLVKRKSGEVRCAIDYRKLNAVTKQDAFPMPRIDDILDRLQAGRVFSVSYTHLTLPTILLV